MTVHMTEGKELARNSNNNTSLKYTHTNYNKDKILFGHINKVAQNKLWSQMKTSNTNKK